MSIDAKAADQFTPLPHRSGDGAITFEGREYSGLEWIERIASRGGTLAAGEGALLVAEIERLRGVVARVDRLREQYQYWRADMYNGAHIATDMWRAMEGP